MRMYPDIPPTRSALHWALGILATALLIGLALLAQSARGGLP